MSEKQFQIIHLGNPYEFVVKDNTTNKTYGPFEGDEKSMSDLLNEQQATIEEQNKQIEEWEFSFRTEMAYHRVAEKELQDKIREQQATINKLKEENEQLKKENRMLKKDLNKLYNLLMDKGMSHNELQDVLWGIDDE